MKRKIFKYIRLFIITITILSFPSVCIPQSELKSTNDNLNKTLDLHAMSVKIEEIQKNDLYAPKDTYNGVLTGYAADCPLCGGTLGCTGQNVLTDRITTYNDKDYGTVRIVASSRSLPCGSIVQFNLNDAPVTAIVLDRGVTGTALDLLVASQQEALTSVGRRDISYNILRFGYTR